MLSYLSLIFLLLIFGVLLFLFFFGVAIAVLTCPFPFNFMPPLYELIRTAILTYLQNFRKQLRKNLTIGGVVLFLLGIMSLFADLIGIGILPQIKQSERMTGDVRIAVADFSIGNTGDYSFIGFDLANNVTQKLSEQLSKKSHEYTVTIWGPERIGSIQGKDKVERAKSAAKIAEKTGANLVVYGSLSNLNSTWVYLPEFFIDSKNIYEVDDITGPYQLGEPLELKGEGNIANRIEVSKDLTNRIQVLTNLSIGLSYYLNQDFHESLYYWGEASQILPNDRKNEKKVLYLLLGNAAGKNKQIELAKDYYKRCLSIDSKYARAYIGLANVYYIKALGTTVNTQLLHQSINLFNIAKTSSYQSEVNDISTKIHFGLGQNYLVLSLVDANVEFDLAINEFSAVISDYAESKNPMIRILAGESYARLGLIKKEQNKFTESIEKYQSAIILLEDLPERQSLYKQRIEEVQNASILNNTTE